MHRFGQMGDDMFYFIFLPMLGSQWDHCLVAWSVSGAMAQFPPGIYSTLVRVGDIDFALGRRNPRASLGMAPIHLGFVAICPDLPRYADRGRAARELYVFMSNRP